ncbi:MAG: hypothetical protein ABW071_11380 [Casimicrobiaceae bacterium]
MKATAVVVVGVMVTLAVGASAVRAQPADASSSAKAAAENVATAADSPGRFARFFDPQDGQLDLSALLEDPRGFLPIPLIVTEPAVGYGGGVIGMFLRPRKEIGDEGWARPDISAVGGLATQNGTWAALAGDASRWFDGRLKTLIGAGTGVVNLDFYGLGDPASFNQGVRYSLNFSGAIAQANWQLAPKSPWSIGLRYVYADVEPTLREDPLFPNLADKLRVKISAPTAIVEYDSLDNVFTPTRGVYAETSYMASRKGLGATDDFERFEQVLIGWWPVRDDVTLGARGNYAWSSSGTPFFMRPFIQLRGVPAMRYQGDQMGLAEVEARWQFYGRWSVVAFGGGGTTRSERNGFSTTQNVGSGGVGFRYELARKFGLHAGIDIAHSPGTTAFYIQVGNAWFRP